MTDHDYLVTVYAVIEITGGYDPESKMFRDVIKKYIYDAFDGEFLQYENYKGSFLPADTLDEFDVDISQTAEGRVSVKFFYIQNDDGAGRKDVESYASYCFKNLPMLEGLRLVDVICDSETI